MLFLLTIFIVSTSSLTCPDSTADCSDTRTEIVNICCVDLTTKAYSDTTLCDKCSGSIAGTFTDLSACVTGLCADLTNTGTGAGYTCNEACSDTTPCTDGEECVTIGKMQNNDDTTTSCTECQCQCAPEYDITCPDVSGNRMEVTCDIVSGEKCGTCAYTYIPECTTDDDTCSTDYGDGYYCAVMSTTTDPDSGVTEYTACVTDTVVDPVQCDIQCHQGICGIVDALTNLVTYGECLYSNPGDSCPSECVEVTDPVIYPVECDIKCHQGKCEIVDTVTDEVTYGECSYTDVDDACPSECVEVTDPGVDPVECDIKCYQNGKCEIVDAGTNQFTYGECSYTNADDECPSECVEVDTTVPCDVDCVNGQCKITDDTGAQTGIGVCLYSTSDPDACPTCEDTGCEYNTCAGLTDGEGCATDDADVEGTCEPVEPGSDCQVCVAVPTDDGTDTGTECEATDCTTENEDCVITDALTGDETRGTCAVVGDCLICEEIADDGTVTDTECETTDCTTENADCVITDDVGDQTKGTCAPVDGTDCLICEEITDDGTTVTDDDNTDVNTDEDTDEPTTTDDGECTSLFDGEPVDTTQYRLETTIDVLLCNVAYRWEPWYYFKMAMYEIIDELQKLDVCDPKDICDIDAYVEPIPGALDVIYPDLRTIDAKTVDECPDLDAYCGSDGSNPQFEAYASINLYCSDKEELVELMYALNDIILTIPTDFADKCKALSITGDPVCGNGLRHVSVNGGVTFTVVDDAGTVVDSVGIFSGAMRGYYYVGMMVVFGVLSLFM